MDEVEYGRFINQLEAVKKTTPQGVEYWRAREIQGILSYVRWESFIDVIAKARDACSSAGNTPDVHFRHTADVIERGNTAMGERENWFLTRYACYLVAMNGDPKKSEVGYAMAYFAGETRIREVEKQLTEDQKRALLRNRVKDANRNLSGAAQEAGVTPKMFGVFHDAGYKGLYGGFGVNDLKAKKGIAKSEDFLDRVSRAELAANEFRITQTEEKLVKERVRGAQYAIETHEGVGRKVRSAIKEIGGEMPENLPAAPSIKKLAAEERKKAKALLPRALEKD